MTKQENINWLDNNYWIIKKSKTGNSFKYPNSRASIKNISWWLKRNNVQLYDELIKCGYDKMTDNVYCFINNLIKTDICCELCGKILDRPQNRFCSASCRSKVLSNENKEKISETNKRTKQKKFNDRLSENQEFWEDEEFIKEKYTEGKVQAISDFFNVCFVTAYKRALACKIKIDHNTSILEDELLNFVNSINSCNEKIDNRTRKIITPLELDIFIHGKNIAIEMNGLWGHSDIGGKKDFKYHLNKSKLCEERGIKLFHIFSTEWHTKQDVWKSVIKNSLGIYDCVIGARDTIICSINSKTARLFCEENHLQGGSNTSFNYGLFYKNDLVSVMTFSKARYGEYDFELQRFCVKKGFKIHGAASKLLKTFRKEHHGSIVSYANRRWSQGNLYEKLGFEFKHDSTPNYFYFKPKGNWDLSDLESRIKFQKHKLKDILPIFDPDLTEWENMQANGYDRIWDCGNKVYVLNG